MSTQRLDRFMVYIPLSCWTSPLDAFRRFARRYTIPWPKSFDALFNLVEMYVPYYHPTCHDPFNLIFF